SFASLVSSVLRPPPTHTLFPYTTLFRSRQAERRSQGTCRTRPQAGQAGRRRREGRTGRADRQHLSGVPRPRRRTEARGHRADHRSEEHTSELQSRENLVCRLLLEKKKNN